jgi:hypothetical protein
MLLHLLISTFHLCCQNALSSEDHSSFPLKCFTTTQVNEVILTLQKITLTFWMSGGRDDCDNQSSLYLLWSGHRQAHCTRGTEEKRENLDTEK